jgi:hypothetical protein
MEVTVRRKLLIFPMISLLIVGCNAASWFQVIGSLLPLAAQVATQFYAYSNKGTVDAGDQKAIQEYTASAQNILETISNAVKTANDPANVSTIQKVDALLKQLQNESNALLASLQVKDANTIVFINTLLADAVDLAGLVPIVSPPITQAGVQAKTSSRTMRMAVIKASALKSVFQARLNSLPK